MKKYEKAELIVKQIHFKSGISSLNEWLEGAGNDYNQAGITTYILNS